MWVGIRKRGEESCQTENMQMRLGVWESSFASVQPKMLQLHRFMHTTFFVKAMICFQVRAYDYCIHDELLPEQTDCGVTVKYLIVLCRFQTCSIHTPDSDLTQAVKKPMKIAHCK